MVQAKRLDEIMGQTVDTVIQVYRALGLDLLDSSGRFSRFSANSAVSIRSKEEE